jgi:hypothetical protein
MTVHEIPTHLDVEDRLLGPLTTRDALYLLVGASAAYGIWTTTSLPTWARSTLAGITSLGALLCALVKIQGRPLDAWLGAGLVYLGLAKRTAWRSRSVRSGRIHRAPGTRARPYRLRMRWRVPPTMSHHRRYGP